MSATATAALRKMAIFGGLRDSALQLILDAAVNIETAAGQYLFREGDPAESLFVLQRGTVQIEKQWNSAPILLGRLGPGDCIGEMALIDFLPRSASVRAEIDCQSLEIPARSLRKLLHNDLEQYAMLMMNMGREVSRRLRLADDRLLQLHHQTTPLISNAEQP